MEGFVRWRVRIGRGAARFSDGLVVQRARTGVLELRAFRAASCPPSAESLRLLGPLAAACTSEGIRRDTGIVSWFHWPDLVTIDGRVVAQASCSSATGVPSDGRTRVVFDISVNCSARTPTTRSRGLPPTSVLDALGVEVDADLLREKVLHALDWYYAEWDRGMSKKLVDRIQSTIPWLGREVEVATTAGATVRGRALGLDERGSLLLREGGAGRPAALTLFPQSVVLVREVN